MTAFAHSRANAGEESWELLEEHLQKVADLARDFAAEFDSSDWGRLAGMWHDVGKFRPEFQRRIRGSGEQAPHASVGAALADSQNLRPLASAIAGHHAGLANPVQSEAGAPRPLREVVEEGARLLRDIEAVVPARLRATAHPRLPAFLDSRDVKTNRASFEMWTRMLFSVLVDADRLATEAFYDPAKRRELEGFDPIVALRARLDAHLERFSDDTPVNCLRARVLADCRTAALLKPGFFSLTVPTGGGKTLSGMAFGLRHAEAYKLRRIIVVAPFTSIIEQNAAVYAEALGAHNIIEHHSAVDEQTRATYGRQEVMRRLAVENWDGPVIVTTAVQFFESLFSNAPSRCRKLHNVVRSVVIVDEAQTLPTEFLLCVLDAMRELVRAYGCSIVLSTATQPALWRRDALPEGLEGMREIVREPNELACSLRRVETRWPQPGLTTPYQELASDVASESQALVVVHTRNDARMLAQSLPKDGRFHLSTRMCAAHRSETLARIRAALPARSLCRVVSTQLVEAGVDIDFPVVFRAMAGFDSLAQAAGRCNRNGLLKDDEGRQLLGRFIVFQAETLPPRGVLRKGLEIALAMLAGDHELAIEDPAVHEQYFRLLFHQSSLDKNGVVGQREAMNFATVASLVRLIDDRGLRPILVPWGDADERRQAFERHPGRDTARALQPFIVQVWTHELEALVRLGAVEEVHEHAHVLTTPFRHLYDPEFGLVLHGDASADPQALMI